MKHDAIVDSGIPILKRYDIPAHLVPPVSNPVPCVCSGGTDLTVAYRTRKSRSMQRSPQGTLPPENRFARKTCI